MNKRKNTPIKPMTTTILDLLEKDVQKALYYMTIKPKNKKGDRK